MKENWKDVIGYEGYYQVSSFGNVYSVRSKKQLKQNADKDGYFRVVLCVDSVRALKKVHHLVYESFIGKLNSCLVVDHIDNNPQFNHVHNLRQITSRKNITRGKKNKTGLTGVRYFKHTEKYGSEIQIDKKTYFLGVYENKQEAKKAYDTALNNWITKKNKPHEIKSGFKLCRVCKSEKKVSEFRETKTMKGSKTYYYACIECDRKLKRERYYKNK